MVVTTAQLHLKWLWLLHNIIQVVPWCSGYDYCTISFNKAWTQVLHRFKSCSQYVEDSWWWGFLTMVPAGNKATPFVGQPCKKKNPKKHHHQFILIVSPHLSFLLFSFFFAFLCYGSQFFAKSSFFLLQADIIFILNFLPSERYGYWNNSEWIDLLFFKK